MFLLIVLYHSRSKSFSISTKSSLVDTGLADVLNFVKKNVRTSSDFFAKFDSDLIAGNVISRIVISNNNFTFYYLYPVSG